MRFIGPLRIYEKKHGVQILDKYTNPQVHATVVKKDLSEEEAKQIVDSMDKIKENGVTPLAEAMSNHFSKQTNILKYKIDSFLEWYYSTMYEEEFGNTLKNQKQTNLRNFIEKMAIWYELRYPEYEIIKNSDKNSNDTMFNNNHYVKSIVSEVDEILDTDTTKEVFDYMEWDEFYNTKAFVNSLSNQEKNYLRKPAYPNLVYIFKDCHYPHLHLSKKGVITDIDGLSVYNTTLTDKSLIGKNIKEADILFEKHLPQYKNSLVHNAIKNYENQKRFKEALLDCVMFRIIERGGCRIGPRRAFIFAKEFNRNLEVPMQFAIDYIDPELKQIIEEYINNNGDTNLACYLNYFYKKESEPLQTINLIDVMEDLKIKTPEEKELYQGLVYILSSQLDPEQLEEETKQLEKEKIDEIRLQRKLEKSNNWKKNKK